MFVMTRTIVVEKGNSDKVVARFSTTVNLYDAEVVKRGKAYHQ